MGPDTKPVKIDLPEASGSYTGQTGEATAPLKNIGGYRADPSNKSGGNDGLETKEHVFDAMKLRDMANAMVLGAKHGVPQLPAHELAALALKEGRDNLGVNEVQIKDKSGKVTGSPYDPNMKGDKELWEKMLKEELPNDYPDKSRNHDDAKMFAVRLANKDKVAKETGKPLAEVWNGTGKNIYGQTGAEYAASMKDFIKAAQHDKNKPLVNFIQNIIDGNKPKVLDQGNN